jgi:eukaryotic-like serine/threonine-protein kinase
MTSQTWAGGTDGLLTTRLSLLLPTPIAAALRTATARAGSNAERLSRRLNFVEIVLRFLVAIQEAERAALAIERPGEARQLLKILHKPTLGAWAAAAVGLARVLDDAEPRLLSSVADGLAPSDGCRPFVEAARALIATRNQVAHGTALGAVPPAQALALLRATDAPFREFVHGLSPLCHLRMVVFTDAQERADERWAVRVTLHRGESPPELELLLDDRPRPLQQPTLVSREGHILRLQPWLALDPTVGTGAVLMLERWNADEPVYDLPGRGLGSRRWPGRRATEEPAGANAPEWIDHYLRTRTLRSLDSEAAKRVHRPENDEGPPRIRRLQTIELLGRGGTGAVWRVADPDRAGQHLALKVLHPALSARPQHIERLRREFAILSELHAPGIVPVEDFFVDDDAGPCMLMQLIEGESLAERLARGPMPLPEAVHLVRQTLETLAIAHDRGIVHRDIKPSNILVDATHTPWLIDFGVARTANGETLTLTIEVVGTLRYMAPEQRRGERAGPAADIYGMARVLQELLLGPTATAEDLTQLPAPIQRVLRHALRDDPAERIGSAAELASALDGAMMADPNGYPLGIGDDLPGGLRITEEGPEVALGVRILRGVNRLGRPQSCLVPRATPAAVALLRGRLKALAPEAAALHGCLGLRHTADGLPYAELFAKDDVRHASVLLAPPAAASAAPPAAASAAPPAAPPAPPAPLAKGTPTQSPAKPPSTFKGSGEEAALLGLAAVGTVGALAAGAFALGALGKAAKGKRAPRRTPGGAPVNPAAAASPGRAAQIEVLHRQTLLLLAIEVAWGTLQVNEALWASLSGKQLGGMLALITAGAKARGPIAKALHARRDVQAISKLTVRLHQAGPRLTVALRRDLKQLRQVVVSLYTAAAPGLKTLPAVGPVRYRRLQGGSVQIRAATTADGWLEVK